MRTREVFDLRFTNGSEPIHAERVNITRLYNEWMQARADGENECEIEWSRDLIEELMKFASIEADGEDISLCDECDEDATEFWPKLNPPVQLCDGCTHNAYRSGWEPGR